MSAVGTYSSSYGCKEDEIDDNSEADGGESGEDENENDGLRESQRPRVFVLTLRISRALAAQN